MLIVCSSAVLAIPKNFILFCLHKTTNIKLQFSKKCSSSTNTSQLPQFRQSNFEPNNKYKETCLPLKISTFSSVAAMSPPSIITSF